MKCRDVTGWRADEETHRRGDIFPNDDDIGARRARPCTNLAHFVVLTCWVGQAATLDGVGCSFCGPSDRSFFWRKSMTTDDCTVVLQAEGSMILGIVAIIRGSHVSADIPGWGGSTPGMQLQNRSN